MKRRAACAWLVGCALSLSAAGPEPASLRFAISETVTRELNGNDLRAAMKTWSEAVTRQTGIRIEVEVCNSQQITQKVRSRQVDAFSVTVLEFAPLAAFTDRELTMDAEEVEEGQEYLLLVNRSSGIQTLAGLRGHSLLLYRNPRTCLDRVWLATLLASARLGAMDAFFGRVESHPKLSRVVLPVFFRQTDACIVTRRGFTTMSELNPQLAAQLLPIAVSPKLMTGFLAFHKDSPPDARRRFLSGITELHKTVEGQQALTLFGGTRLVRADVSLLRSTLDLLHFYEKLPGKVQPDVP